MDMKKQFLKKLYDELLEYKSSAESLDKEKDVVLTCIYTILLKSSDDLSDVLFKKLVNQSCNILESLYSDFVEEPDKEEFYSNVTNKVVELADGPKERRWDSANRCGWFNGGK